MTAKQPSGPIFRAVGPAADLADARKTNPPQINCKSFAIFEILCGKELLY